MPGFIFSSTAIATTVANFAQSFTTKELVAINVTAHRVKANELCAGNVYVNQQQLAALLSQAGATSPPESVISPPTEIRDAPATSTPAETPADFTNSEQSDNANRTPPVISINGANTAQINVGNTYADLGATIAGPQSDLNLGITTLLDGATTTSTALDTTEPGTHTIQYIVTNPAGLTGSATRTVTVSAANDNPPPAEAASTSQAASF